MIKAIIFDCWNTLYRSSTKPHQFVAFAERIGKDFYDYEFMKLFEEHFMLEKHYDFEIPIKQILKKLKIDCSEKLIKELKEMLEKGAKTIEAYPDTREYIQKLKKDYKIGMISNTGYIEFKILDNKFKIKDNFDIVLLSYETGILKPSPKIFRLMLDRLNLEKEEVLMVGDSLPDDARAAESFGIKAVLLDRRNKYPNHSPRITSLKELEKYL